MAKSTGKPIKRRQEQAVEAKVVKRRPVPAGSSIESRENQIIRLAYDLLEERFRKKTASAAEVTTAVKLGSSIAQLEKEKLRRETEMLEAKAEQLKSQKRVEELYAKAMTAYRTYSGQEEELDET